MKRLRFLGIDYGAKRIGLAISDERGTIAFPKTILENSPLVLEEIRKIIEKESLTEVVIGKSLDLKGKPNAIDEEIEEFIKKLKEFNLPINSEKEFLTSIEARRALLTTKPANIGKTHRVDARAAALILQRYLDRLN